ncbi:helix-turn-helix domain-containing protein [Actinophytocola gossypii]|uniref:Helix-turn-helix transcriptional regulator n=1 Tax=Actinophytocola gossypii TaxID=2812003 RepID=A0ABT2J3F7_9PSEU|nr:helix-turn-helix transcriptional regulator [Actinophytocola gossypii]MCT2582389.1 helix-turn-helix transcriptional regulator [Actinophytocola gossypii]
MGDSFGARLQKCRLAAGMTMGELARRTNYSKGHISKIENGHKPPNPMLARLCDEVLRTGGELVRSLRTAPAPPAPAPSPDDEVLVMAFDETGELRYRQLPRRVVLAGAGAILGDALVRGSRSAADEHTVVTLRVMFDQLRSLGTMMSPVVVLGQAMAQLTTVRSLAADGEEPVRAELLLLASRIAEYTGWMSQEAGDESAALRWTDQAVRYATAGRDPHLASFALVRRAELAMYRQDAIATVALARQAQTSAAAGPRILGQAARCEAQGHALAGDRAAYERAMERAGTLLAAPADGPTPVLGSASVTDQVPLAHGWSLYDLGRPAEAAAVLDDHVPRIPPAARRARARFGTRRALAHAQQGDVDQACAVAREVLTDAAQVDSATVRIDLRQLARTLARWHTHPDVRTLHPHLMALLHMP